MKYTTDPNNKLTSLWRDSDSYYVGIEVSLKLINVTLPLVYFYMKSELEIVTETPIFLAQFRKCS